MYEEVLRAAQEVIAAYDRSGVPESDWEDGLMDAIERLRQQMEALG